MLHLFQLVDLVVEDCLQPVINIVPLQLLAYHPTVLRGYNVDQLRNLAKSNMVEKASKSMMKCKTTENIAAGRVAKNRRCH
ncbi:hypothetical protein LIER_10068 [Lithospermum erythrorhizon]|uniref:Uncharacterized protein n=1 Tax=Lithospermum erythrorhizon TaxID=34254 RepID=A0AAV3PKV7_LITER